MRPVQGGHQGENIVLRPTSSGVTFVGGLLVFTFVDKEGRVIKSPDCPGEGDRLLTCPHCGAVHLFGMDRKEQP
jgi:hypothetical protein